MLFTISFYISLAILIIGIYFSIVSMKNNKKKTVSGSFYIFATTIFISSVILFIPIYYGIFKSDKLQIIKTILLSVHNTIRLFIVDGEFNIISDYLPNDIAVYEMYSLLSAMLFVIAPLLTFGIILSFFKNILSYQKLILNYNSEIYIFSELNLKSLILAKSILDTDNKRLIVFTDVFEQNEEENYELISSAKSLGALCFKTDIAEINFKFHNSKKSLSFFIIGEDDTENAVQCLKIINNYKIFDNTSLYLFSNTIESELLIASCEKGKMKVRRINNCQSLIFRNLYDNGEKIFDNARPSENSDSKDISVIIIGLGSYGTQMLKELSWFCQMDNYNLYINAFDKDINCTSNFKSICPELMDTKYNGNFMSDEDARYKITIHSGIDALSSEFNNYISSIHDTTFVFVSLGDDELNIKTALKVRQIAEMNGIHPQIQAIVYNAHILNRVSSIVNFKGQEIDIEFIGDREYSYSEKVILRSDLEKEALNRHLKWGSEEDFWNYEYNYRSSIASVIHKKMKIHCKVPGIEKESEKRTDDEKRVLRKLEHRRWNAYMRSEGYSYAPVRNDLAKQHNCLVPFGMLSEEDKRKDDD